MSQQGMRTFSTEFKKAVVLRLEAGERIAAVSEELRIRRKLLYEWRAAYRKLGAAGLNRKRGRKPGGARASPDAAPAAPGALPELARDYGDTPVFTLLRGITATRPSLPFCLSARGIALGLASPLAGGDGAVEAAADCVEKRVVAERAADQLAPPTLCISRSISSSEIGLFGA